MTDARPLVSAIVPVYQGAVFVADAIRSVLAQTYRPIEIVAVDDGSPDGSAAILRSFPQVNYRHQRHAGVATARNHGARVATGDFLAFLDQDDLWLPEKIDRQMRLLFDDASLDGALTEQERFLERDMPVPAWVRAGTLDVPLRAPDPSALLVRRAAWDRVGPFNETLVQSSDADWQFRAKDLGLRFEYVPEVLVHRRVHSDNNSRFAVQTTDELRRIALASIRRHRQGAGK